MSANSAVGQKLRALRDVNTIHLRIREMVKERGAGDRAIHYIDDMRDSLIMDDGVARNEDEWNMPVSELDRLLTKLAVMTLKASLKAKEQEWDTCRQQMPWFLSLLAEAVYFTRRSGVRQLKRIVEDL